MDEGELEKIGRNRDMFERLCYTLSHPDIHAPVTEAAVLQLAGGVTEENDFGAETRGEIHLAIVSDSTANTSRFISAIADLAPRSEHLNGTNTTLAGAVGSVRGGELTPGPLLKPSVEFTYIEQLDATDKDTRGALQQILDASRYSFAKSNYQKTVPSGGSVTIAVNPRYGVWDEYEPIGEQLSLGPEVTNSVDLVLTNITEKATSYEDAVGKQIDPVSPELAREFLELARSKRPVLNQEAEDAITDFVERIEKYGIDEDNNSTKIGPARLEESLARFTQAHARFRLSDTASRGDAKRAIWLAETALRSRGIDPETGKFDADVVEAATKDERDRIKNVKQLIADIEEESDGAAPIDVVLDRASEIGLDHAKAEHEIDKLKQKGEAYEPSTDHLRTS